MSQKQLISEIGFVNASFDFIPGANTFRMGEKYRDLIIGQELRAFDAKTNEDLGVLVVEGVHTMRLGVALAIYADDNHGVIEALDRFSNDMVDDAADHLRAILASVYPDIDCSNDDAIVVVVEFAQ